MFRTDSDGTEWDKIWCTFVDMQEAVTKTGEVAMSWEWDDWKQAEHFYVAFEP